MRLYHVTEARLVPVILERGIIPQIGPRSARLGEPAPRAYFFRSLADIEDALFSWLFDEFGEDTQIALLRVDHNREEALVHETKWEVSSTAVTPPSAITVLTLDIGSLSHLHDLEGPPCRRPRPPSVSPA